MVLSNSGMEIENSHHLTSLADQESNLEVKVEGSSPMSEPTDTTTSTTTVLEASDSPPSVEAVQEEKNKNLPALEDSRSSIEAKTEVQGKETTSTVSITEVANAGKLTLTKASSLDIRSTKADPIPNPRILAASPQRKTIIMHTGKSIQPPTWLPLKSYMQKYCEPFFVAVERWRNTESDNILINRVHIVDTIIDLYETFAQSQSNYIFNLQVDQPNIPLLAEVIPTAGKEYCSNGDKKAFESSKQFVPNYLFHRIGVYFQSLLRHMAGKNDSFLKNSNPIIRKSIENCIDKLLRLSDTSGLIHIIYKIIDHKSIYEVNEDDYNEKNCNFIYPVKDLSANGHTFLNTLLQSRTSKSYNGSFLKDTNDDDNNDNRQHKNRIKTIKLKKQHSRYDNDDDDSSEEEEVVVVNPKKTSKIVRIDAPPPKGSHKDSKVPKYGGKSPRTAVPSSSSSIAEGSRKSARSTAGSRRRYGESSEEDEHDEDSQDEDDENDRRSSSTGKKSLFNPPAKTVSKPPPKTIPNIPQNKASNNGKKASSAKKKKGKSPASSSSSVYDAIGTKVATYLFVPNSQVNPPEVRLYVGEIVDIIPPTKPNIKDQKYIAKWYDDKDQEEYILDIKAFENAIDLYKVNNSWTVKHSTIGSKVADYFYIPGIIPGAPGAQKLFVGKVVKYCPPSSSRLKDQLYHILWEDGDEQDMDECDFSKAKKLYKSMQQSKQLQLTDDLPLENDINDDDDGGGGNYSDDHDDTAGRRAGDTEESRHERDKSMDQSEDVIILEENDHEITVNKKRKFEGMSQEVLDTEDEEKKKNLSQHSRVWVIDHPVIFTKIAKEKKRRGKGGGKRVFKEENYYTGVVIKFSPETYPGAKNQRYLVKWDSNSGGKEEIFTEDQYQDAIKVSNEMFVEKLKTMPFLPGLEVYTGKIKPDEDDNNNDEGKGKKNQKGLKQAKENNKSKESPIKSKPSQSNASPKTTKSNSSILGHRLLMMEKTEIITERSELSSMTKLEEIWEEDYENGELPTAFAAVERESCNNGETSTDPIVIDDVVDDEQAMELVESFKIEEVMSEEKRNTEVVMMEVEDTLIVPAAEESIILDKTELPSAVPEETVPLDVDEKDKTELPSAVPEETVPLDVDEKEKPVEQIPLKFDADDLESFIVVKSTQYDVMDEEQDQSPSQQEEQEIKEVEQL